jgi:hypothetical protein
VEKSICEAFRGIYMAWHFSEVILKQDTTAFVMINSILADNMNTNIDFSNRIITMSFTIMSKLLSLSAMLMLQNTSF